MSLSLASISAVRSRTEQLPQFQLTILRLFLANLSTFSSVLPTPALLLLPLPLPLLFLLLLLRSVFPDVELKLGSGSSRLLREHRLLLLEKDFIVSLQFSRDLNCRPGRALMPEKKQGIPVVTTTGSAPGAAPHAYRTFHVSG